MSATSSEGRTPQESADHLAEALDHNTKALNKVKRRSNWQWVAIAVMLLGILIPIAVRHDQAISACNRGNDLREQFNAKFIGLADNIEGAQAALGQPITPEGRVFLDLLRKPFDTRSCDLGLFES